MSRIGKKPVKIPAGVQVTVSGLDISVKGPKGSLALSLPAGGVSFGYDQENQEVTFERKDDTRDNRARHGLYRSLFNNNVVGVTQGYKKVLLIVGVGYRAALKGNAVELSLGYCDPKILEIPQGISVELPQGTRIEISGIDKQAVGQFAALIRKLRPPEPYKGKGVMYEGEVIRRKAGKSFAGEGG